MSNTITEDNTGVGVARRRHRQVLRCCLVFTAPEKLQTQWAGLKTLYETTLLPKIEEVSKFSSSLLPCWEKGLGDEGNSGTPSLT